MIETLTDVLLVAGMAGTGALWVFAIAGILHIGWKATGAHLLTWLKQKR
jgi:hypothetical protein